MIPRIIHQIYLTGDLPVLLQKNVDYLKKINPDWTHRLWDAVQAEDFIVNVYGNDIYDIYAKIDSRYGAARSDLLRHLLLYAFGGVYFDIKSGCTRPLNDVLLPTDEYTISQWTTPSGEPHDWSNLHPDLFHVPGGEYVTYFIAADAAHPLTKAAIDKIRENISNYKPWNAVGRAGVVRTTGPIAYTLAIHPLLSQHKHRIVNSHEFGLYPSLGGGYDHKAVFKNHYSRLRIPVVRVGFFGRLISGVCTILRSVKHTLIKPSHWIDVR